MKYIVKHLSKVYVVVLLLLLFAPMWLQGIQIIKVKPVIGSFVKPEKVSLTAETWFNTSFQEAFEQRQLIKSYLSPVFIRIFNQIDYSFFDQVHMSLGVLGKDNYLFVKEYLRSYTGGDKINDSLVEDYAYKMRFISDTLEKLNKHLLYVQYPGKAAYFPEYFPDEYSNVENPNSNYYTLMNKLDKYNINHVDFRKYIIDNKNSFKYPMFTKTGIHMSEYCMPLMMDTLVKYLNKRYQYQIPNIEITEIDEDDAKELDNDIEAVMNLLFQINGPTYAYPKVKFPEDNSNGLKMLLISDSYLGNMYWKGFHNCFDDESQFWFYNKTVYCDKHFKDVHLLQLPYIQEALKHELIIISSNEPNLIGMSWEFVDNMYYYFKDGVVLSKNNKDLLDAAAVRMLELKKDEASISKDVQDLINKHHISYDSALFVHSLWDVEKKKTLQNAQ